MSYSPTAIAVLALAIITLTAALGLLLRGVLLGYPRAPLAGSILSAKEQAILAASADAFFPPGGPIPLSGTEAGVVAYMDRYVRRIGRPQRVLIRLLLRLIEHGPWIFGPRPARFTRLTPAERIEVLRRMSLSRVYFRRLSFLSLRVMLTMGYFANDQVARQIGALPCASPFEPPEPPEPRAPLVARPSFA
ncbi:MAG: hypothetical protein ABI193_22905 [Minicystis sp.]